MAQIEKGERRALNVTEQGNRRIFVGLSWDPSTESGFFQKIKEMLGGPKSFHDLDLSCFVYNADQDCIAVISGKSNDGFNSIYHSGDDTDGSNSLAGDDEQISVELANISDDAAHIVFKAAVLSGASFNTIRSPLIRLVDGYSDHHFARVALDSDKAAYVFVELYRDGEQWMLHGVHSYEERKRMSQWKESLKAFLSSS